MSVVQKLEDRPLVVSLCFKGLCPKGEEMKVTRLTGNSLLAANTFDTPHEVAVETEKLPLNDVFTFPPASLTFLEFSIE